MGIEYVEKFVNLSKFFLNNSPIILDIGFGVGFSLVKMAKERHSNNYLGIEVYFPGILQCLRFSYVLGLKNLRVINYDVLEVLKHMVYDFSFERIQIFFPDPWPKNRHKKRRLLNKQFIILLYKKLKRKGELCISTDCQDYAENIVKIINSVKSYINIKLLYFGNKKPFFCPTTVFEKKSKLLEQINFYILCVKL